MLRGSGRIISRLPSNSSIKIGSRTNLFRNHIFNQKRNVHITNPQLVALSDAVENGVNKKNFFKLLFFAATTVGSIRYYFYLQKKEKERAEELGSGYRRSVPQILLSYPVSFLPFQYLSSKISSFYTHLLLLRTISRKGELTEGELFEILSKTLPEGNQLDPKLKFELTEIILHYISSGILTGESLRSLIGGSDLTIVDYLHSLLDTIPDLHSFKHKSEYLTSLGGSLSLLLQNHPDVGEKILTRFGLEKLSEISEFKKSDKLFFLPILKILSEISEKNPEELLNKDFVNYVKNAVVYIKPSSISTVTATTYASFKSEKDKLQNQTRQKIFYEVAKSVGNISYFSPNKSEKLIENDILSILLLISNDARDRRTILHTSRSISNLSASIKNHKKLIEGGWIQVLQHWITTECMRSVTKVRPNKDGLLIHSKLTILDAQDGNGGELNDLDVFDENKVLTITSLVGLTNLSSSNLSAAQNQYSNFFIRDLIESYKNHQHRNVNFQKQLAKYLASLAYHEDLIINKRLLSQVGVDGFDFILDDADEDVIFNIATCVASLTREKIFAKQILNKPATPKERTWEIIEQLANSKSKETRILVAQAILNIIFTTGANQIKQKRGLEELLKNWSTNSDKKLGEIVGQAVSELYSNSTVLPPHYALDQLIPTVPKLIVSFGNYRGELIPTIEFAKKQ